jgi:hypothetical protein
LWALAGRGEPTGNDEVGLIAVALTAVLSVLHIH